MLSNEFLRQQCHAARIWQEVMKRAHDEGLVVQQMHDTIYCKDEEAVERINQIFKEVQHDFKRTKAMVARS